MNIITILVQFWNQGRQEIFQEKMLNIYYSKNHI